jgi:hypothetical protein
MMTTPETVTQASPLLVRTDSADSATPALCLALNDRVSMLQQGSQLVVIGTTQAGVPLAATRLDTGKRGRRTVHRQTSHHHGRISATTVGNLFPAATFPGGGFPNGVTSSTVTGIEANILAQATSSSIVPVVLS